MMLSHVSVDVKNCRELNVHAEYLGYFKDVLKLEINPPTMRSGVVRLIDRHGNWNVELM